MNLTVRVLGLELLSIEASTDGTDNGTDNGDCTTYPVGFVRDAGGSEWQAGVER